jgi:hypothetical protein
MSAEVGVAGCCESGKWWGMVRDAQAGRGGLRGMSGVAGEVQALRGWRGRVSALWASRGWGGGTCEVVVWLSMGFRPMATDWRRFAAQEEAPLCGFGGRRRFAVRDATSRARGSDGIDEGRRSVRR